MPEEQGMKNEINSVLPPPPGLIAATQQVGRSWPQPTVLPQSTPSLVCTTETLVLYKSFLV